MPYYLGYLDPKQFDRIETMLGRLLKRIDPMQAIDRLREEVAENRSEIASNNALLAGLSALIRENVGNEAALLAIADDLSQNTDTLTAAVFENTPTTPTPPPAEVPPVE